MKSREEKSLIKSYERGEWKSTHPDRGTMDNYRKIARATIAKDRRMNIRISSHDLAGLQAKAIEEGIPYQTLVSSILHKYVAGRLVEKQTRKSAVKS